jgi:DNA-binding NarL/FixJ family response regulator
MKSQSLAVSDLASADGLGFRARQAAPSARPRGRDSHRIRVLLADDHPVVRRGIASCLERRSNLEVVAEAADGEEALRKAREMSPDIVLSDMDMPNLTGLGLIEALHKELPTVKVLILSMHPNPDQVLRCAQAGANGYVLKQASPEELVQAIETVSAGEPFYSPDVARVALNKLVRGNGSGPDPSLLSNREREVLTQIAEGLSNKEIACLLNIGTRTVETHRERLMRKLNIHTIAGLTRFAIAKGMVILPELAVA